MLGRDAGKDAPIVTWWLKLPFEEVGRNPEQITRAR